MRSKIYRSLPSLVTIQAFVICSEFRSINKAAEVLCRSQGAISKQLQQLESFYNVVLFERTSSGLELTEHGREYLDIAYELLDVVGKFDLKSSSITEVQIYSPSTFALRWLLPRIDRIKMEMSGVNIHIRGTYADKVELDIGTPSLAVVRGLPEESDMIVTELFPELLTPMCSQSIFKSMRSHDLSLDGLNLLHASPDGEEWSTWLDQNKTRKVEKANSVFFDTLDVALSAAEDSLGVVIGDPAMAVDRLEAKRLVMPFRSIIPSGKKYFLCYREQFSGNRTIKQLVDAIVRSI